MYTQDTNATVLIPTKYAFYYSATSESLTDMHKHQHNQF